MPKVGRVISGDNQENVLRCKEWFMGAESEGIKAKGK
jgi:hypothetical protein